MRKEIFGVLLFFLVILTLISLLSYSPADPSIHNARAAGQVQNLFGLFGAHLAGILVGFFGLGSFWIPVLLLLSSIHLLGDHASKALILTFLGGILLVISTGGLLAFSQDHYTLFGTKFSSGGIIGIPLRSFLIKYSNVTGGTIILALVWIIGFIMATGFSLVRFAKKLRDVTLKTMSRLNQMFVMRRERRKKAKKLSKTQKTAAKRKDQEIKIETSKPKPIQERPVPKQDVFEFMRAETGYQLPSINFLD
jgi:S-DNA-T family DNA segregation ATPase FtsK/SpoIIIE